MPEGKTRTMYAHGSDPEQLNRIIEDPLRRYPHHTDLDTLDIYQVVSMGSLEYKKEGWLPLEKWKGELLTWRAPVVVEAKALFNMRDLIAPESKRKFDHAVKTLIYFEGLKEEAKNRHVDLMSLFQAAFRGSLEAFQFFLVEIGDVFVEFEDPKINDVCKKMRPIFILQTLMLAADYQDVAEHISPLMITNQDAMDRFSEMLGITIMKLSETVDEEKAN